MVPAGPGVFLGEALVTVVSGNINLSCYNCTARDIEFSVSPVTFQEFEIHKPTVDSEKTEVIIKEIKGKSKKNIKKIAPDNRFARLINELHLENLNEEEKISLIKAFKKYPFQFCLKGDKLGCTNMIKHIINTVDNNPVNKNKYRYPTVHKNCIQEELSKLQYNEAIFLSKSL